VYSRRGVVKGAGREPRLLQHLGDRLDQRDRHGGVVGAEGAVDALLICGWYRAISYVARATRLAPEPGAPRFADISAAT